MDNNQYAPNEQPHPQVMAINPARRALRFAFLTLIILCAVFTAYQFWIAGNEKQGAVMSFFTIMSMVGMRMVS